MALDAMLARIWTWTRAHARVVVASLIVVGLAATLFVSTRMARGCSSRDDVTARVAVVSSAIQAEAAQGKLKVEELAAGIKRLNDSATAYNTNADHAAYCEALDKLAQDYKLTD